MKNGYRAVLLCTGAVIGAGFASGKEIITFFTRYGRHAWWLILLSSLIMSMLAALCMTQAGKRGVEWYSLLGNRALPKICMFLLLVITAGAMISAAGHMTALVWNWKWAYAAGALGTLLCAWFMASGQLKALGMISALLTLALLCALMAAFIRTPSDMVYDLHPPKLPAHAVWQAAGYASMNMMLALGVVCRSARYSESPRRTSFWFGWLMAVLLMLAHSLYSRHPEVNGSVFPMVKLLSQYGRKGYLFSVCVLYLAILTTLASLICALRAAAQKLIRNKELCMLAVLGLPLAASRVGFEQIVDRLYAPAGIVCLVMVFVPIAVRRMKQVSFS